MAKQYDWAWQPFGPDESIDCFAFPGSHYRGFPVIKVSDEEKERIQAGEPFEFKYKKVNYRLENETIKPAS